MSKKTFQTRIQNKHDIEANWLKATNFTPLQGEIIIYDIEIDKDGNILELPSGRTEPITYERIKIGDGKTLVNNLPFSGATAMTNAEIDAICGAAIYAANDVEL